MAFHNVKGQCGEDYAAAVLVSMGYTILHRNWRYNHKEVDAVALHSGILVFVEVKTRTDDTPAADLISPAKIRHLLDAAEAYIAKFNRMEEVRFDVLIVRIAAGHISHELIADAFR